MDEAQAVQAADDATDPPALPGITQLRAWAAELGFASCGVADLELADCAAGVRAWLAAGWHGEMDYLARNVDKRLEPARLVPGVVRAIMVTMDYAPAEPRWRAAAWATLAARERAYVSRYALGRDYHRVVRHRLERLARRIATQAAPHGYRVFCDSAPVLEVALAQRAGLGWRGKHTLLIDPQRGSTFFLGTLYTTLPFAAGEAGSDRCGRCTRCLAACPTGAIVAPYRLDARRCISYLTIEHRGPIPPALRPALGNRIYGCDDCQLACPWNRFARPSCEPDFAPRAGLDAATLAGLFAWRRAEFEDRLAGSPIRRIGHERWLRNLAVALGNAGAGGAAHERPAARSRALAALRSRSEDPSALVREHVEWAIARLSAPSAADERPRTD